MGQPSAEWLAEQRAAEAAMIAGSRDLYDAILIVDREVLSTEVRASVLSRTPNGNPEAAERLARAMRLVVDTAAFVLANYDRVHLLEEPARRKRAGSGR